MASLGAVSAAEHTSGGFVHKSLEPPASPLVLSYRLPVGSGLRRPVPIMDRVVSLCLSPDPTSREDAGQDQGGSDRRGHRHHPQLAEEVLVPPPPSPDGMQNPSPALMQEGSPVTMPAQQGHLFHAEQHFLQDKGFSEAAIKMIFATTRDTTRAMHNGRWESF